jgi:hypothetical protein
MANLFFPQLSSGAMVQYPIRKTRHRRTILNTLADGSIIAAPDSYSGHLQWELVYQDLSAADGALLEGHFANCFGPWLPFVFIDPTANMLSNSTDFRIGSWQVGPSVAVQAGAADPFGGNTAFTVTNAGQTTQEISQTLAVPAWYQYCFSVYAASATPSQVELIRRADASQSVTVNTNTAWARQVSSGQLSGSTQTTFTVAISLAAGQQLMLCAPQLEPQIAPSTYSPTAGSGGVYPNAHWAMNNLTITADSPSQFNTTCIIDTNTST